MEVETVPVAKAQWLDLVLRMKIPPQRKAVAFALSKFGNADGTRVFPSQQKVADMAGLHETNARGHIRALLSAGMLKVVKRGGGRGGATNTYRLTRPADITTLPLWLDPEMNRPDDGDEYRALTVGESAGNEGVNDYEHQASALGVSVGNSAAEPVDNPGTPSADGRHFGGSERETPSVLAINTERFGPEYRALALPDLPKTNTRPTQHHTHSPNATNLPTELIKLAEQAESEISDEDYSTARGLLALLPDFGLAIQARAEAELIAAGIRDPPMRLVIARAADLATRPTREEPT